MDDFMFRMPVQTEVTAASSTSINAFNAITGAFVGSVTGTMGHVITIDQLWAIDFSDGVPNTNNGPTNELFFTAGPDNISTGGSAPSCSSRTMDSKNCFYVA
jgi:hypothetical protein